MEKSQFWEMTSLLMGLKYDADFVEKTLGDMMELRESSVWQAALGEGRVEGARNLIIKQGNSRFGKPTAKIRTKLEAVTLLEQLDELGLRLHEVESWDELLK